MGATRLFLFFVGVILVVAAAWMLFFQTGLQRWIPLGVAAAGLLLFIGLAIMAASDRASERTHTEHHEHH